MLGVAGSQLSAIPGGTAITGIAWRICNFAGCSPTGTNPWPAANTTWSNYLIEVSSSLFPVPGLSTTYALNQAVNKVVGRTGSLTIPAGSFPTLVNFPGPSAPFGFCIGFTTSFVYPGGDIVFMLRHPGSGSPAAFLDAVAVGTPGVQGLSSTTEASLTGVNSTFTISKIVFAGGATPPALSITKTLSPGQPAGVVPGSSVSFDVTVTNTGGPLIGGSVVDTFNTACMAPPISCASIICIGGVACGTCSVSATGFGVSGISLAAGGNPGDTVTYRVSGTAKLVTGSCTNSAVANDGECASLPVSASGSVDILALASQETVDALESKLDTLPCDILKLVAPKGAQGAKSSPCPE